MPSVVDIYLVISAIPWAQTTVAWHLIVMSVTETNSPVSQYERPRTVALASSACVDKTTNIITEFTRKDPFLHLKRLN